MFKSTQPLIICVTGARVNMPMKTHSSKNKYSKGFALLFSIVVVSVVVVTTLAISSLVRKGLDLTSIGERSMEAFFAADAGLECALYWDIHERSGDYFPRSTSPAKRIECFGNNLTPSSSGSSNNRTYHFSLSGDICVDVTLVTDNLKTSVKSRGFNTCDTTDPGRIERGLEAMY